MNCRTLPALAATVVVLTAAVAATPPAAVARGTGRSLPRTVRRSPTVPPPAQTPIIFRVPTTQPVVFFTIDDGWSADPRVLSYVRDQRVPITTFLLGDALNANRAYFAQLHAAGMPIQNHTLTHPDFHKTADDAQRREICGDRDKIAATFGEAPVLFRPPYGNRTASTPAIAAQCGSYVTVLWSVTLFKGTWEWSGPNRLVPGDIILMHYSPQIGDDIAAALAAARAAGLRPAPLLAYVGPYANGGVVRHAAARRPKSSPYA